MGKWVGRVARIKKRLVIRQNGLQKVTCKSEYEEIRSRGTRGHLGRGAEECNSFKEELLEEVRGVWFKNN